LITAAKLHNSHHIPKQIATFLREKIIKCGAGPGKSPPHPFYCHACHAVTLSIEDTMKFLNIGRTPLQARICTLSKKNLLPPEEKFAPCLGKYFFY
jgi:hypothetical protein